MHYKGEQGYVTTVQYGLDSTATFQVDVAIKRTLMEVIMFKALQKLQQNGTVITNYIPVNPLKVAVDIYSGTRQVYTPAEYCGCLNSSHMVQK